jgi:N-acetylglucosaminyldiphosphoundecaprenol N-acetyl-beta-D-mannosaminyltransferase
VAKAAVLNVKIDAITMVEALIKIEKFITERRPRLIATANAEMVMLAQEDNGLAGILDKADLVLPDGAGVVWAARYMGQQMPERVAGYDLVQRLLAEAAIKGYRIYFFGGAPNIADQAKLTAENNYPGVSIVGTRNGYFTENDEPEIIADICDSQPDILLVALGIPKQEKWLAAHIQQLKVPVAIGVGGTFDVMAGVVQRAPLWMQRTSLEWLFRLLRQPTRFVRMLALPRFVLRVMSSKKG